mgnify:CR=1 FL=1
MHKLMRYIKGYERQALLAPLFKMLEACFELFVPLVIASIIDTGIKNQDAAFIWTRCGLLVLLAAIGLASSLTAQWFSATAALGFGTALRKDLFRHIDTLSYSELDGIGTPTLVTRMTSDINQVQNGVNLVLRLFLRSPFIVFGAMVMAFTIDVKAALVFVVTIPLLSIIVFGIMLISIPLYKKVQSALDKVLGITRENLTGSRVIRAFNKEDDEKVHFNENNDLLTRAQIYVGKISALMNPLTYAIINGAIVVLVWTGAVRVDNGYITQGEVVALINYMSQILVELVKLANLIININKSIACGNRIQSIFEMQPSITDGSGQKVDKVQTDTADRSEEAEYAVEFSHVGLTYAGAGDESLTDIDFKVKKGETIGIIGGTGSGKSSVVNLIPRFYDVTSGFIKVDGKDIKDYPLEELRGKIGTVLQKAVLFHGTIRENLKWGNPDATEEDLNRAITVAQAKEFVDNKEGRLDFEIEQGGKNLSGGQRQRLTIARAVVKKPEILILDDSASALDFATDAALRKAIREMEGETTVFIVSQRAASIQHADRIVVLDDGKIVGLGTSEELLESCEVYQEIYNSQFKKQEGGKTA